MIKLNNKPACWWRSRAIKIVGAFDVLCIAFIIAIIAFPALAATAVSIPGTNIVLNLGDMPPWIMAFVVSITWYEARAARKLAAASDAKLKDIGPKIDGMLVDRDAANRKEGKIEGKLEGEQTGKDAAAQLAKGQREGRENERASVAAQERPPAAVEGGKGPLPVADDRTAKASERVADASERVAGATEKQTDLAKKD